MMQCLFDQYLSKSLEPFSRIWFFKRVVFCGSTWCQQKDLVFNALQWPMKETHQALWNSLLDYGRLKWQSTLRELKTVPNIACEDVLDEFDKVWCQNSHCYL